MSVWKIFCPPGAFDQDFIFKLGGRYEVYQVTMISLQTESWVWYGIVITLGLLLLLSRYRNRAN